jgi:hypothetical protein
MFKSIFLIAQIVGVIAGKVVNSTTGEGIPGASVFVEGTTLGASTDKNGIYFIKDVPVGRYTLIATAVGFEVVKVSIVVTPEEVVAVNFKLIPETEKTKQTKPSKALETKSQSLNLKFPKFGFTINGGVSFLTYSYLANSNLLETLGFAIGGSIEFIRSKHGSFGISIDYNTSRSKIYFDYNTSKGKIYISLSGIVIPSLSNKVLPYINYGIGYFWLFQREYTIYGYENDGIFIMFGGGLSFKVDEISKFMVGVKVFNDLNFALDLKSQILTFGIGFNKNF